MKKFIMVVLVIAGLAVSGTILAKADKSRAQSTAREKQEERGERKGALITAREAKLEWKTNRQTALENLKQQKEDLKSALKTKLVADRCAKIQEKIQAKESNFGSAKVKHMSVYTNLQNRIQKFIDRFKAFDTANPGKMDQAKLAKLVADFAVLKQMIADFQTSFSDYFSKLKTVKVSTCQSTEGDFRGSLADAKVYLASVHETAASIREYVRTTITPDLLAVKQDIASIKGTAEDEDESGDEDDAALPVVSITAPADNTSYAAAATVAITASAEDKDGISKVEFYDGATLKGTDTEAPFAYDWAITAADNGTHSWTAKAFDKSDPANAATSAAVNLVVNIAS